MRRKKVERPAGFYRTYRPNQVHDLEEAIEITIIAAVEFGLEDLQVNRFETGITESGSIRVGLRGRMRRG